MCPRPCHVHATYQKQASARCENGKNIGVYLVAQPVLISFVLEKKKHNSFGKCWLSQHRAIKVFFKFKAWTLHP